MRDIWMARVAATMVSFFIVYLIIWDGIGFWVTGTWIDHFQTLITGFLAIGAAFVGGYFISLQIRQTDRLEADRRNRRREAARSVLPVTLAELTRYADDCGRALAYLMDECAGAPSLDRDAKLDALPALPVWPTPVVSAFKEFIEFASERETAYVSTVTAVLQVQNSRILNLWQIASAPPPRRLILEVTIIDCLVRTAEVSARAGPLFVFSRRQSDVIVDDIAWSTIWTALFGMGIVQGQYPHLDASIAARSGSNGAAIVDPMGH